MSQSRISCSFDDRSPRPWATDQSGTRPWITCFTRNLKRKQPTLNHLTYHPTIALPVLLFPHLPTRPASQSTSTTHAFCLPYDDDN
ncbi:hypothetical protein TCAL_07704 [Tigriopus californicus]|uniref:Uncharacterized protein n=1 Tax=Tigriopus californicus TaxID=6832 RepID=A0A553NCE1_TIGCA|nr:hypothetical protein TCAL_07704 [Tigriopus californicus]